MMGLNKILGMAVIASALVISGCGQNVVGPTAPDITNPTTPITMDTTSDLTQSTSTDNQVNASCFGGHDYSKGTKNFKNKFKAKFYKNKYKNYLMRLKSHLQQRLGFWMHRYYTSYAGKWVGMFVGNDTLNDILTAHPLFLKVVLRHHLDRVVMQTAADIVTQTWAPGEGTDPSGFDPEVTLVPFQWRPNRGFYGALNPGWVATPSYGTDGYTFDQTSVDQDVLAIYTQSFYVDVYKNLTDMLNFQWRLFYKTPTGPLTSASINLSGDMGNHLKTLKGLFFDPEGVQTQLDFWISVLDKSGYYRIYRSDGTLDLILQFDSTGAGGGTLDILNHRGTMDHYVYVLDARGRGYWTRNDGRKHPARW